MSSWLCWFVLIFTVVFMVMLAGSVGAVLFRHRSQAEGVTELTPKGFIDWCRNGSGYERKHLYDDKKLNEAVQVTLHSLFRRN